MILFVIYLLISALVFARLEIEIEGPHGWAEKLPTWRINNRWTRLFYGSRPLTGYHLWMQIFVLLQMVHVPLVLRTANWSWGMEIAGGQLLRFLLDYRRLSLVCDESRIWDPPIPARTYLVACAELVVGDAARLLGLRAARRIRLRDLVAAFLISNRIPQSCEIVH